MAMEVPAARATGKKILMFCGGTRGDMQPMIAVGQALVKAGFVFRLGTNSDYVPFGKKFGLDCVATSYDFEAFSAKPAAKDAMTNGDAVAYGGAMAVETKENFPNDFARQVEEVKTFKPDMILTSLTDYHQMFAVSWQLEIPMMLIALQPLFYPGKNEKSVAGEKSGHWEMGLMCLQGWLMNAVMSKNEVSAQVFPEGKDKLLTTLESYAFNWMYPLAPILVGTSPRMRTHAEDWPQQLKDRMTFTGFWIISKEEQVDHMKRRDSKFGGDGTDGLAAFIDAGEPAYIGWGSMISVSPEHMCLLAVRSLMKAKLRGIVVGGWAGLNPEMLKGQPDSAELEAYAASSCYFVKAVAHEWLFPQCSVIVHHGGAGTMASSLRSGKPTVLTPIFADQFANSDALNKTGCGVGFPGFPTVTPEELAQAMIKCTTDKSMAAKCRSFSATLLKEDGLATAVKIVDDFLTDEVDTGKWKRAFDERSAINANLQHSAVNMRALMCRRICRSEPFKPNGA